MSEAHEYEVAVVGGGPAGLTAALYTTRLGHETALIDRGGGRAAMMADTHNVVGVTEETSGNEYLQTGLEQVKAYGADHYRDMIREAEHTDDGRVRLEGGDVTVTAERVVLATGFSDGRPDPPAPRTARGLHYCLHCDAYMFVDAPVYVMGHSSAVAHVAMIMLNFTDEVDILLNADVGRRDGQTGPRSPNRHHRRGSHRRRERRRRLARSHGICRRNPPGVPRRLRDVRLELQHRPRRATGL
jgi:thioredoxin reductase (NADPH)